METLPWRPFRGYTSVETLPWRTLPWRPFCGEPFCGEPFRRNQSVVFASSDHDHECVTVCGRFTCNYLDVTIGNACDFVIVNCELCL